MWLVLECADIQALDALSAPDVPIVRLRRIVREGYEFTPQLLSQTMDLTKADPVESKTGYPDFVNDIQRAVWWFRANQDSQTQVLQGEIHLRHTLPPSAHLGYFKTTVSPPAVCVP